VEESKNPLKIAAPVAKQMLAWTLGKPGELSLDQKEVLFPIDPNCYPLDAVAVCATDLDVIANGPPALINGTLPFNQGFTPGHEYMGTVAALGPGVDEYKVGERVAVEIHSGCGQCKRCRSGMYTSCTNYGQNYGSMTSVTAPMASRPTVVSRSTRSIMSIRWCACPMICRTRRPRSR